MTFNPEQVDYLVKESLLQEDHIELQHLLDDPVLFRARILGDVLVAAPFHPYFSSDWIKEAESYISNLRISDYIRMILSKNK